MILYKFKSLKPFSRLTDELLGRRFYCPTPQQLNDPMEGILGVRFPEQEQVSTYENAARFWLTHDDEMKKYRLCSFSGRPDSILMWSYYGAGHSGICIEVDMSEHEERIKEVKYVDDLSTIDTSTLESILTHKLKAWKHENEYRLILVDNEDTKYAGVKIKKILIGARMGEGLEMRPLFRLCAIANIELEIASFDNLGNFKRFPIKNPWAEQVRIDNA